MFTERDILVDRQRRRDMMDAAAKDRLVRIALAARKQRPALYERWLAHLGAWLVELGSQLEARYAQPAIRYSPTGD
jgi:phosphopantetheinyl transferase